jgi:hypothetical protein
MLQFPKEPKKIRERVRSYERALRKEHETFGAYDDSFGKRYLLGPLYLLMGDIPGAVQSYNWFEQTFPDDMGEPFHDLCWALALYQSGNTAAATRKLQQAMLSNLYLLPHLLGLEQERLNIWHGSNYEQKEYLQDAPIEIWTLWDQRALDWANATYNRPEFLRVRARYVEIQRQLKDERPGARRSQLVAEAFELRNASQS